MAGSNQLANLYAQGLISPRAMGRVQAALADQKPSSEIADAPYFQGGENSEASINAAFNRRDLDKQARRTGERAGPSNALLGGPQGRYDTPEENEDRFNRLQGASSVYGAMGGVLPSVAMTGADFYSRHGYDPDWLSHAAEEAGPLAASTVAGPVLGRAIRAAPRLTAAVMGGAGILGATGAGEAEPQTRALWDRAGMTKQQWNDLEDTKQGRTTKSNLIQKFTDQDIADQERSAQQQRDEQNLSKSTPDAAKLKRLGLTEADWRAMAPDARSQRLTQMSQADQEEQQKAIDAAKPWRETHQEISNAIPWASSAFWGAVPYVNRTRAQGVANSFSRAAGANATEGRSAMLGGDLSATRAALDQAKADVRLAPTRGVPRPAHLPGWVPAGFGAVASTVPEEIDIGQKMNTPNEGAAWGRLLSLPEAARMGMAGAASHAGNSVGEWFPTQKSIPFPQNVKPFITSGNRFVREAEQSAKASKAAKVVGSLPPQEPSLPPSMPQSEPSAPTIPSRSTSARGEKPAPTKAAPRAKAPRKPSATPQQKPDWKLPGWSEVQGPE